MNTKRTLIPIVVAAILPSLLTGCGDTKTVVEIEYRDGGVRIVERDAEVIYVVRDASTAPDAGPDAAASDASQDAGADLPALTSLSAFYNAATHSVGFVVEGDGEFAAAHVRLFDADGDAAAGLEGQSSRLGAEDPGFVLLTQGAASFEARHSALLAAGAAAVAELEVRVEDPDGSLSEPMRVGVSATPTVDLAAECDLRGALSFCGAGSRCAYSGSKPECMSASAPVLASAEVSVNVQRDSIGVRVTGSDADADVRFVEVQLLTAGDAPIAGSNGESLFAPLDQAGATSLSAELSSRVSGLSLGNAVRARVTLWDAADLTSAGLLVDVQLPATLASGAADCDAVDAFDVCPGEELCLGDGADGLECRVVAASCPGGAPVGVLDEAEVLGGWALSGDNADASGWLAAGACAGGGKQSLFSFSAPETASYRFALKPADSGALATLSLRRACDDGHARVELDCREGVGDQEIFVLLNEAETVYMVVDGLTDPSFYPEGFEGEFVVSAQKTGQVLP